MSSQQEEYLDGLLNSMQDEKAPSLQDRFQDFDLDIVSELSRDKDLEWESKAGNQNKEETVATEDVINASLDNLLAGEKDDPNKALSADEIAALFAQANATEQFSEPETEEEQPEEMENQLLEQPEEVEEQPLESPQEIVAPQIEPVSDDPNKSLSADEIAALFAQANAAESVVAQEPVAPEEDGMMQMSQEEIASLINAANTQVQSQEILLGESEPKEASYGMGEPKEDPSLDDILREFDGDKDLEEIQSMLQKSDSGEKIAAYEPAEELAEEEKAAPEEKKKEKAGKKEKKQKAEGKPKKKGFFEKLFELITEEIDEDATEKKLGVEVNLSDENAEILAQLEDRSADGTKKGRKEKKKKEKDPAKEKAKKQKPKKEKAPKKEKPPKPKKEKKPKEKAKPDRNRKPFSKKLLFAVAILAFTIFAGIYLFSMQYPKMRSLETARKAFYNHDYKTAYYEFYGKKLKESDQALFDQAYVALKMQHRLDAYQSYASLGMDLEAIDALMQGVAQYNELYDYASTIGATGEVERSYQEILAVLQDVYGLNELQVSEIVQEKNNLCYTLRLKAVLEGREYVNPYENLEYYMGEKGTEPAFPEDGKMNASEKEAVSHEGEMLDEEQYIAE